jgi:hypothetical protein
MSDPYQDANAIFEGIGRLYSARFHRLRPGKDEGAATGRDSRDEDNIRQFSDWIKHDALFDAVRRIDQLEAQLSALSEMSVYVYQS